MRPFLANVLKGRRVPPERVEEVAHHYDLFGGVSPITDLTFSLANAVAEQLHREGPDLPVFVGMRNWRPFLSDTLDVMASRGIRRAIGLITAAQRSAWSCLQYKENVAAARATLRRRGGPDVEVTYVNDWHAHEGFIAAHAAHVREARARLTERRRGGAQLVFTAHSIPLFMADAYPYVAQLREAAALVAAQAGMPDWTLVYQSRSGQPEDLWLEPDVCDYLRSVRTKGLEAVVLCPIGFVCDHIEVLYDLDTEAATVAREIGLEMTRAKTPSDHPLFVDALAGMVRQLWARYARGVPLSIVPA